MVTENVSKEVLNELDKHDIPYQVFSYLSVNKNNYHDCTLNKLHIFKLEQYDKACFVDADVLFTHNIDYIMDEKFPLATTNQQVNNQYHGMSGY